MFKRPRSASVLVWCLTLQLVLPARSVKAYASDSSTLPSGRSITPAASPAAATPSVDLLTGAATWEIPIDVPAGTGGMAPQLALRYSSQKRSDSWVGYGWSLEFPSISRSLKFGVPKHFDDTDTFVFDGQELVPENATTQLPRRYHTLRETFLRIVHEADGSWSVTSKDGTIRRFGIDANSQVADGLGSANGRNPLFQWLFAQEEDTHNNAFTVRYDRRDAGIAYIANVHYTLHRDSAGTLQSMGNDPARDRVVTFSLESAERSDVNESYRAGFLARLAHRLDYIDVKIGTSTIRRYDLHYLQSGDSFRSLLDQVALYGTDTSSGAANHVTAFTYTSNFPGKAGWFSTPTNWPFPTGISLVDASGQDKACALRTSTETAGRTWSRRWPRHRPTTSPQRRSRCRRRAVCT